MSKRCYSQDHLWLDPDGSGMATVGVTRYAQGELGDILFVELPEPGAELMQGQSFGVIESVKTASELIAPASGPGRGSQRSLAGRAVAGQRFSGRRRLDTEDELRRG